MPPRRLDGLSQQTKQAGLGVVVEKDRTGSEKTRSINNDTMPKEAAKRQPLPLFFMLENDACCILNG